MVPLEVSLSRMRKEPCVLPEARSCRSASLRLMFLKNHLRTRRAELGLGKLMPPLPTLSPSHSARTRLLLNPTHGSGSRLFRKATKL